MSTGGDLISWLCSARAQGMDLPARTTDKEPRQESSPALLAGQPVS